MTSNSLINVEAIKARQQELDDSERWFAFDGPVLGELSPTPFKVKIYAGGKRWGDGWTKGMQDYVRGLPGNQKRRFQQEHSRTHVTLPPGCLELANRAAIRASEAVRAVALVGPPLESLEGPLPDAIATTYGLPQGSSFPEDVLRAYVLGDDGTYRIPLQATPPEMFLASPEQVLAFMGLREFVNDVGAFHAQLMEGETEQEAPALKNSVSGSGAKGRGKT